MEIEACGHTQITQGYYNYFLARAGPKLVIRTSILHNEFSGIVNKRNWNGQYICIHRLNQVLVHSRGTVLSTFWFVAMFYIS